jgi:hypothetical protein
MKVSAHPFVVLVEGSSVLPLNVLAVTKLSDGRVFIAVERTSQQAEEVKVSEFMLSVEKFIPLPKH